MKTCPRCGERPAEVHGKYCIPCWHQKLGDMLLTVISFSDDAPVPFGDGFRMAVLFDGEFSHWLCDDVHASEEEARACLRDRCTHGPGPHWNEEVARQCRERRTKLSGGR